MTRAHESFGELTKDVDMDIDDPGERALNILRRERSDPSRAPDEPTPLRLKPFDAAPGDETCAVKYTFRNELTTIGEVVEELAEMLGVDAVRRVARARGARARPARAHVDRLRCLRELRGVLAREKGNRGGDYRVM